MKITIPSSNSPSITNSTVAIVESEIYLIGGQINQEPSSAVQILDCRSLTWRDAPSMNVARLRSCVYDGKLYVMGGCKDDEPWAEVFDTKTQSWELLTDPFTEIRKCCFYRRAQIQGKIYFQTASIMYAYDIKQDKWESWENKSATLSPSCVMDNVCYCCNNIFISFHGWMVEWYDINGRFWKGVQGLDSLRDKYMTTGGSKTHFTKLLSCNGKLLLIWQGYMMDNPNDIKEIWCAEIAMEKRDGGAEVWGNVEWVDLVHSIPTSSSFLHCLAVSV